LGDEKKRIFPSHIDKNMATEIIRKVGEKYGPESIMTFGGEPLLYSEAVYAIHREATRVGIPSREVITNGFWSTETRRIQEMADYLVKSGANEVDISVDFFHQEFIPIEIVKKTAESLLKAGMEHISWNPCWVVSKEHDNPYDRRTRAILEELKDLPIENGEGNVIQPEGRAIFLLTGFLPSRMKMTKGKCGDVPYTEELDSVKGICVEPDGRIGVCKEFYIGNASETDIIDLIENYDPFKIPEAKAIVQNGMVGLTDWARNHGIEPDPKGYYNICHMCTDIRRRARGRESLG